MPEPREAAVRASDIPAPDFDVREFARTAAGSHRDELNLGTYSDHPLDAPTVRCLAYLQATERATMTHLRSVLVTATHKDARITAFLTTWAFEKYWIADALEQIVMANRSADAGVSDQPHFRAPSVRTIRESIVANIIGEPMIAVHMSLGTVDEWMTQAAYRSIRDRAQHPQLFTTLNTFLEIKVRQLRFFEAQARHRLADSKSSQRLVRRRLSKTAWPLGSKAMPSSETKLFFGQLFDNDDAEINKLDSLLDTLPGQSGLALMHKVAGR